METKSRYEVIADLEDKKRHMIVERDSFPDMVKTKEKEIKKMQRDVDDKIEELDYFKDTVKDRQNTLKELIASVDDNLKRFSNFNK